MPDSSMPGPPDRLLGVLEPARAALPPALIDADGYARLAAVAAALPAELTNFWGFECRLGQPEALADILLEIRAGTRGPHLLAGDPPSALDALRERWPVWAELRDLARRWLTPGQPLQTHVRNLWLEFDTATATAPDRIDALLGLPSVFLGPNPDARAALPELAPDTLGRLGRLGRLERDSMSAALRTFLASLPDERCPFQVGTMLGRPERELRVCVNRLPPDGIPDWLRGLGWPGSPDRVAELLRTVAPLVRRISICLTLAATGPGERIGIECYLGDDRLEMVARQWMPLLELLERLDLCLPAKRRGLLDFPGVTASPLGARRRRDGVIYTNLFRRIHHVKLSVADGRILEAKAYLALNRAGIALDALTTDRDAWSFE